MVELRHVHCIKPNIFGLLHYIWLPKNQQEGLMSIERGISLEYLWVLSPQDKLLNIINFSLLEKFFFIAIEKQKEVCRLDKSYLHS